MENIKINFLENNSIAEILSDSVVITSVQDALDLMADCSYQGASKMILYEKNILPEFFDLKTKIAGEILQKYSNYRMQLAIVGDFTKFNSKSLHDFIYESNKAGRTIFVGSLEEALKRLSK
jgi:hypothetical protein